MAEAAPAPQPTQSLSPENLLNALLMLDREMNELTKQQLAGGIGKSDYENKLLILKKRQKDSVTNLAEALKADPEAARLLRYRLYAKRTVQLLLTGFAGGMVKKLSPQFDPDRKARYPILENIQDNATSFNPFEVLDELAYLSILEKKLYERMACCPKCGSPSAVFLRIKCPECGSLQLESSKLIEHLVCGTVQEFDEFANDGQISCPSCHETLTQEGEDYRVVGTFNRCESCMVHFDEPQKKFICRTCEEEFDIKDSAYYDTYAYSLSNGVLAEVKAVIGLPIFKTALEELGYSVELPGKLSGASGMIHNFTLTGAKNGRSVAVDVADAEAEVDEKELFAFYTKIADLKSTLGILIVTPKLSERAREFANKAFSRESLAYIEAASPPDAIEHLKLKLRESV